MPDVRLAMFDCDGTLVDGQANICRAMEATFDRAGLTPPPRRATRRIVGLSLPQAMLALAPDADHDRLAADYRAIYRGMRADDLLDDEPLFDGVAETLAALAVAGWTLGIATGKSDRGLDHVLARHGLAHHFATLQTADRHASKPHPAMLVAGMAAVGAAPDLTVMIGDTSYDMAMAHDAGVRAVGVAWGYHAGDDLRAAGAEAVADHARDLMELLA